MSTQSSPSLSKQVFNGTKWYVAMRWCLKGMGLVSSAFLARLLVPEDFGLVATALVVLGVIELLFEFGVTWALLQNNQATDDHFNTAWTIRLFQATAVAVILLVLAPHLATFYQEPRMELIAQILAFTSFISGFENIGTVKFQKEMKFFNDFKYNVLPKILSTFATICFALYYQSYIAILVATCFSATIKVITSYLVISFRPRLSLKKFNQIWNFSKWILIRNFADYISQKGDLIIVSLMTNLTNLGYYRWGSELSSMAISEVQQPFSRALIPALVNLTAQRERLIAAYLKALSAITLVAIPIALGFGAVSLELIPIFLGGGDKWLPVVPIINGLVFFAMASAMYGISNTLLTIDGHVKKTAYVSWFSAIVTLTIMYPAYQLVGLVGIAYSRAAVGLITFFIVSYFVHRCCGVALFSIFKAVWRSLLAGVIMYIVVLSVSLWLDFQPWLILLIKVILGAIVYSVLTLIFWLASGSPSTLEADIVNKIKSKFGTIITK